MEVRAFVLFVTHMTFSGRFGELTTGVGVPSKGSSCPVVGLVRSGFLFSPSKVVLCGSVMLNGQMVIGLPLLFDLRLKHWVFLFSCIFEKNLCVVVAVFILGFGIVMGIAFA